MLARLLKFYVYSNIHISISAALFVASAYAIVGHQIYWPYVIFVGAGTFLVYNMHRIVGLYHIQETDQTKRHHIQVESQKLIYGLMSISVVFGIVSFVLLPNSYRINLIPPVIIALLYVVPTISKKRLRDIQFFKIFLIAIVWSYFYVLPIIAQFSYSTDLWVLFSEKFLYILAITIPFDIRDRKVDYSHGLKTIATAMNANSARLMALSFMIISLLFSFYLFHILFYSSAELLTIILIGLICLSLIFHSLDRDEWYYLAYLDGTIGLYGLLIFLASYSGYFL